MHAKFTKVCQCINLFIYYWKRGRQQSWLGPQNSKYNYNVHYKLSVIILEKVDKLFNSISDIGREFHSRMVRGKKLAMYVVVDVDGKTRWNGWWFLVLLLVNQWSGHKATIWWSHVFHQKFPNMECRRAGHYHYPLFENILFLNE